MTDQQDWDAAATEAGYLPTSDYVARWEKAREAAHEALKTAREMTTEIKRLRGILKRVTPDPVWGEDPHTKAYYREARATLQPKEGNQ